MYEDSFDTQKYYFSYEIAKDGRDNIHRGKSGGFDWLVQQSIQFFK